MEHTDYSASVAPGLIRWRFLSRVIGTPLAFLCVVPVLYQNQTLLTARLGFVAGIFVWSYAAYYLAARSRHPFLAGDWIQVLDSLFSGGGIALVQFNLLPTVTIVGALCVSNMFFGGPAMLIRGLFALVLGALAGGAVFGFTLNVTTEPLVLYGCLPMIVIYPSLIGLFSFQRKRELEHQKQVWRELSQTDGLTGLLNRRAWEEAVAAEFQRFRCGGVTAVVVMLDIDHFKRINDRYGHSIGDEVLCRVGACIARELGLSGNVGGRYGGEEFGLLLTDTNEAQAVVLAERLRCSIAGIEVDAGGGETLSCRVSLGVAGLDDTQAGYSQWVDAADRALYLAKRSGRNRSRRHEDNTAGCAGPA